MTTGEMRRGLDRFDRDIMRHMLLWAPHGVPYDEDIFPEFEMNVQQFRRRFARIVWSLDSSAVDDEDRNLLDDVRRYLPQNKEES